MVLTWHLTPLVSSIKIILSLNRVQHGASSCITSLSYAFFKSIKTTFLGKDVVKIMERRAGFTALVFIDKSILGWVLKCLQEAIDIDGRHRLLLKIRVGDKMFLVLRKEKKRGRFLLLSVVGKNGKEKFVVFPEGLDGYGWRNLVSAMRLFLPTAGLLTRGVASKVATGFPDLVANGLEVPTHADPKVDGGWSARLLQ